MASKPRIMIGGKDMIWTLIPLLAVCALVAIASQNCSVGLTGTASDDRTPAYDVHNGLAADARVMAFPIRRPPTPQGWKPNSGSTGEIAGKQSSNVGWITAPGAYLQLTQTDASEDALVGELGGDDVSSGTGVRQIGGHKWVTYSTYDGDKFWITDLGDVRIAVMSKGPDSDMETMAASVLAQQPLSRTG
ncbi:MULTISPECIES: DUF4245 domain-containing protein [unclassified Gordonia (in: high G+C Gram-positive bacteria)]